MTPTKEQIAEAVTLYNEHGWSYPKLAKKYQCAISTLHKYMEGKVRRGEYYKPGKPLRRSVQRGNDEPSIEIPEHVRAEWLERAKAYAARTDLTAIICGDPVPGWSALERR
jgi:hypothetical protein